LNHCEVHLVVVLLLTGILQADPVNSEELSSLDLPWQLLQGVSRWIDETTTLQKRNKKPLSLLSSSTTKQLRPVRPSFTLHSVHLKIDRFVLKRTGAQPDVRVFIVASDSAE
jgi:hypothetical protein